MINTNQLIINFFFENYLLIFLLIFLLIKIIPTGENHAVTNRPTKISLIRYFIECIIDGIIYPFWLNSHTMFTFNNTITIIIFLLIIFSVFITHIVSKEIVILINIAIISLYLERLIETGKNIKFFGNLISWERKDK